MTYKFFKTVALAVMGLTPLISCVHAADYDPVPQYSEWAFRLEGGAGYTGVTFRPQGGPSGTSIKTYDRVHFADSCTQGTAGAFLSFC
jgi:hypothetical protein